mmetsp:Transcript_6015/g.17123  ORF Transcript_6015/g.17123 Transcript_6015/m.17123 type:complete len:234 (+) Transcript_6015:305-1006(+)
MAMTRETISTLRFANMTAGLSTEWRKLVLTKTHTQTMNKNRKKSSTLLNTSSARRPSLKTMSVAVAVLKKKRKKSNTSLDHTVLNKEERSSWVSSLMIRAHLSPMITVEKKRTAIWLESPFLTALNLLFLWTVFLAKNPRTTTTTETMQKTRMKLLKCANKSTKVLESANKGSNPLDTFHQQTTMPATTLQVSRLYERTASSHKLVPRQTRLPPSSSVSSSSHSFSWLLTYTT